MCPVTSDIEAITDYFSELLSRSKLKYVLSPVTDDITGYDLKN